MMWRYLRIKLGLLRLPMPKIGERYIFIDEAPKDPWGVNGGHFYVTISDVKDGWVKYDMAVGKSALEVPMFLALYQPARTAEEIAKS
jgi:hypothetical protein